MCKRDKTTRNVTYFFLLFPARIDFISSSGEKGFREKKNKVDVFLALDIVLAYIYYQPKVFDHRQIFFISLLKVLYLMKQVKQPQSFILLIPNTSLPELIK